MVQDCRGLGGLPPSLLIIYKYAKDSDTSVVLIVSILPHTALLAAAASRYHYVLGAPKLGTPIDIVSISSVQMTNVHGFLSQTIACTSIGRGRTLDGPMNVTFWQTVTAAMQHQIYNEPSDVQWGICDPDRLFESLYMVSGLGLHHSTTLGEHICTSQKGISSPSCKPTTANRIALGNAELAW